MIPRPGFNNAATANDFSTFNFFSTNVSLNQLIWDFGQTSGRWRAAQAGAQATADQERSTAQQIVLQVRSAFFTSRADKELVGVARGNLENQRKHLEQIEGFVEAGTRPPIETGGPSPCSDRKLPRSDLARPAVPGRSSRPRGATA